jgi:hypothetical protein
MPSEHRYDARDELLDLLLHKVDQDPYPSTTMMDMIEEMLTREYKEAYARILMDKISADNFPSMSLIARVKALD